MSVQLVIVRPFGTYNKGDMITDTATIANVLAGESVANVVRVTAPPQTSPQKGS
jgi:hypothetical protein